MAQMELATDVLVKRSAPLQAMFRRTCELGVLVGGAQRTTHLFGRRIDHHYRGKLQTVLDQRETRSPGTPLALPDVVHQAIHSRRSSE